MFFMVTATFPPDKGNEFAKTFIKVEGIPYPPYLKSIGHYVHAAGELGIKAFLLFEVEEGKEWEGQKWIITNRIVPFHDILGYRYKIEPLLTPEEALPMVGLASP